MKPTDVEAHELSLYDLTPVPDEQLCQPCLAQVVLQRGRIEMGCSPAALQLCSADQARQHVLLRERMSFPEAAADWSNMVRDIEGMKNQDGWVPVRILLPNGTALTSKVRISVEPVPDSINSYHLRRMGSSESRELKGSASERTVKLDLKPVVYRDHTACSILSPGSFHELHVRG